MKTQVLKSIFLFCILHLSFSISSNAQIVYTNIPDVTITSINPSQTQSYNVDINNDSIMDFWFQTQKAVNLPCSNFPTGPARYNLYAKMNSLDSTAISTINSSVQKLSLNVTIDSSNVWNSAGILILRSRTFSSPPCSTIFTGNWATSTDGYAGVRLQVNNLTYYGWVRLNVYINTQNNSSSITIRDYAYNSVPDQPILAGDTGTVSTGITHNNIQHRYFSVSPNPATNSVTIKFSSDKAGEISIVNLFGEVVYKQNFGGLEAGEITIDVSKFSEGMYVVRWSSGENNQTKIFSVIK
ncbi:MAG: T9SS type A sorting domain-containing protein [Bacteroidia bacterium]